MGFFDDIGGFFSEMGSDLFSSEGLADLGQLAPALGATFAPAAFLGAGAAGAAGAGLFAAEGAGAGAAGLGAAEGAGALGFGAEAAGEAGLGSWFSGLGEAGMAGEGALGAVEGGSDLLALTAPETTSAWPGMDAITSFDETGVGAALGSEGLGAGDAGMQTFTSGGLAKEPAGLWDKLVSGATSSLTKNPLGIGMAAIGLGKNLMGGNQDSAEMEALRAQAGALGGQAGQLNAQGQQLASYLQSGTLPPGLQTSVDQAAKAYKARIIANHAKNGMSTDPRQNSALSAELAQADINAVMMTAQLGQQLLQSGTQFLNMGMQAQGLSSKIYEGLVRLDREQSKQTGVAIANFASALSGGGGFKMAA